MEPARTGWHRIPRPAFYTALIAILLLSHIAWFNLGTHPFHWDSAIHFSESLNANRIGSDSASSFIHQALFVSWYYPPFVSYAAVPVYKILGETEFAGLVVMLGFLLVLAFFTYFTGSLLFDRTTGLLAAIFISTAGIVMQYSRMFMLDLPLAAVVAMAVYLLLRTENFTKPVMSAAFGVASGFGLLTKWTFPVYILVPVVYTLLKGYRHSAHQNRRIGNFLLAMGATLVVSAPWYTVHALQILTSRGGELGRGAQSLLGHLLYYITALPAEISWTGLVLSVIGVALYLFGSGRRPALLFLWWGGAYILLTCVGFKQPRFAIPLLEPFFLMSAAGFVGLLYNARNPRIAKSLYLIAPAVLAVVLFLAGSFISVDSALGTILRGDLPAGPLIQVDGPSSADWRQEAIVGALDSDRMLWGKSRAVVRVIPDEMYFNNATIGCMTTLRRLPLVVSGTTGFPLFTDYVLLKSGEGASGQSADERQRITRLILADTSDPRTRYRRVGRWRLPDATVALLYRVDPQPVGSVSSGTIIAAIDSLADNFIRRYLKPRSEYRLIAEDSSEEELQAGRLKSLRIRMKEGEFGDFAFNPAGVPVSDVDIELRDVRFDPRRLIDSHALDILSVGALHVKSLAIEGFDLKEYVDRSSKGKFSIDSLRIEGGRISLEGRWEKLGQRIGMEVVLRPVGTRNVEVLFRKLSVGFVPLPSPLVNVLLSSYNPVITGLDVVPDFRLGRVSLTGNEIRIGSAGR